jgi:hypothetical protein
VSGETPDIRVLTTDDELIEAGNIFRTAMIGFPPLNDQQRGLIGKLLEPGRTLGVFVDGRLAVLYSPYDILSGVNRESNAYAKGIATDDAVRVLTSIITYALSH